MQRLILARHGETEYSSRGALNGDPAQQCPLTDAGRAQARRLGKLLAAERIDLCVTTQFQRTVETADLALEGRDVPRLVVPELGDHAAGEYEGGLVSDYLEWAHRAGSADPVPGADESRFDVACRFAQGFRTILETPEDTVLAVLHALAIGYLLSGPLKRMPVVGYAEPQGLEASQVEAAIERLDVWCAAPSW
jgi:broad specificity phosphatase PhoE